MKRGSLQGGDSMHEAAPWIGALRRRLRLLLPGKWFVSGARAGVAMRGRRPARVRTELDPDAPASSWVAWEVSRRGRPS